MCGDETCLITGQTCTIYTESIGAHCAMDLHVLNMHVYSDITCMSMEVPLKCTVIISSVCIKQSSSYKFGLVVWCTMHAHHFSFFHLVKFCLHMFSLVFRKNSTEVQVIKQAYRRRL